MKGNRLKCIVTASSCVEISNKYLLVRTTINLNKKTNANYDDDGDGDGKCGYVSLVSLSSVSTRIMISLIYIIFKLNKKRTTTKTTKANQDISRSLTGEIEPRVAFYHFGLFS